MFADIPARETICVVVQFGGQTPLNIARALAENGVISRTSLLMPSIPPRIATFRHMMERLESPCRSRHGLYADRRWHFSNPSAFLSDPPLFVWRRAWEVIYDKQQLREYVARAFWCHPGTPPVSRPAFSKMLWSAKPIALADGTDVFIPGHHGACELAGIHSGDSALSSHPSILPPNTVKQSSTTLAKLPGSCT